MAPCCRASCATRTACIPTVPMVAVAKEISLEDVRLGLEKMPDRFTEHPATVLVITNLNYSDAPRLMLRDTQLAAALNWQEIRLTGDSAHAYEEQIEEVSDTLADALGHASQRKDRQSGVPAAFGAGGLSRGPQVPARQRDSAARPAAAALRPDPRLAALAGAHVGRVQGLARCWRRWRARWRRAAGCSPSSRPAGIRRWRSSRSCGPARIRSRSIGTRCWPR